MSNDALILDLATNLKPVKRRSTLREASLLIAIVAAEGAFIIVRGAMRPDMGQMIGSSFMTWKVGSLAILAAVTCTVAMRSFSPPASPRRGLKIALVLLAAAMIGGLLVASSAENSRPILDRIAPARGVLCAASIIVLALPLAAMLGVVMRRAAPTDPGASALAAGAAAGTCAGLVFTLCCPMNDPLYVMVWYCIGCAVVTAVSRWLLPREYRL